MKRRFEVWYSKRFAVSCLGDQQVDVANMEATHTYLCGMRAESMDEIFAGMQGENWSPNGEARPIIEALGLQHTSMSVGDIIHDVVNGKWYKIKNVGFELIGEDG